MPSRHGYLQLEWLRASVMNPGFGDDSIPDDALHSMTMTMTIGGATWT